MADPYVYPNTEVLKNKANIKSEEVLKEFERTTTALRIKQLEINPKLATGNFDLKHLQKIHGYIFQDVYEWAGQLRTVQIAKGSTFCPAQNIESFAQDVFKTIKKQDNFKNMDKELLAKNMAMLLGEINVLHPFREGNGRTQREFARQIALQAGHKLDFKNINQQEMIKASIDAFNCKYSSMIEVFQKSLEPIMLEKTKTKSKPKSR